MIFARNNYSTISDINYKCLCGKKRKEKDIVCEYCNKEHTIYRGEHEYVIKIGQKKHTFCSYTCRERWRKEHIEEATPTSLKGSESV